MYPLSKKTSDGKGGLHTYLSFRTLAIPELSWIYYLFYVNGMKVISEEEDLIYYLNGRVLAYWIMDDGSWTGILFLFTVIVFLNLMYFY